MGALGTLQEKSVGKDAEQSNATSENVDFDCRIFELKVPHKIIHLSQT